MTQPLLPENPFSHDDLLSSSPSLNDPVPCVRVIRANRFVDVPCSEVTEDERRAAYTVLYHIYEG